MPIPIPQRASGFTLGNESPLVKIDVFFDIQCPHSKKLWPTLLELLEHYKTQRFSITAHLITLSNHRQSWDLSLGLFAVAQGNSQRFFDFVTFLFERQDQYLNAAFRDKTHQQLREFVSDLAHQHAAVEPATVLDLLDSHDVYIDARTPIRYAATRAVWATPTIFINNADDVPVNFASSLSDWNDLLDPLFQPTWNER